MIIETEAQYTGAKGGIATGIFETQKFISENEEYKLLDEALTNAKYDLIGKNITKRMLKSYDSYAEASKAREKHKNFDQ